MASGLIVHLNWFSTMGILQSQPPPTHLAMPSLEPQSIQSPQDVAEGLGCYAAQLSEQAVALGESRTHQLRQTMPGTCGRTHIVFGQRLRRRACSFQFWKKVAGRPMKQKRRRRGAHTRKVNCSRMVDDDSAEEQQERPKCGDLSALLLSLDVQEAQKIRFTTHGTSLHLDGLQHCRDHVVRLSETVAMFFAGGVDPISCVALQSGRLTTIGPVDNYQLQNVNGTWVLVADGHAYFNFILSRWQPLSMVAHGPYAPAKDLLYVAFVPQKVRGRVHERNSLFVKLGYRDQVQGEKGDQDSLIGYLEKKSATLQLSNVPGAGIFAFEVPKDHYTFDRPCRAAEASLKTAFLHSAELIVTPSGHCGDVGVFSASLEYFFVEEAKFGCAPLPALTRLLRSFTGDCSLLPQCAVASRGGDSRRGRKSLQPWPEDLDLSDPVEAECVDTDCGNRASFRSSISTTARAIPSPMHALRSRAKCAQMRGRVIQKVAIKGARSRKTC